MQKTVGECPVRTSVLTKMNYGSATPLLGFARRHCRSIFTVLTAVSGQLSIIIIQIEQFGSLKRLQITISQIPSVHR